MFAQLLLYAGSTPEQFLLALPVFMLPLFLE